MYRIVTRLYSAGQIIRNTIHRTGHAVIRTIRHPNTRTVAAMVSAVAAVVGAVARWWPYLPWT